MSRRINLMLLVTDLKLGGTPRIVSELALHLDASRFRTMVVALGRGGPFAQALRDSGVECRCFGAAKVSDLSVIPRVVALVRRFRPEVIHSFLFHANVVASLAARLAHVRVAVGSVRTYQLVGPLQPTIERWAVRALAGVTVPSEALKRFACRKFHVPSHRCWVIANGVDLQRFANAAAISRSQLNLPPEAPVLAWVGRFDPVKGLRTLLEAMELLWRTRSDVHLLLVGANRPPHWVQRLVASCSSPANLHVLVARTDVENLLASADVFVFPSLTEGAPNALLEAMAAGKPIVASDIPAVRELLQDRRSALLSIPGQPRHLAERLLQLLGTPELSARLGQAARQLAQRYRLERTVQAHESLYLRLLGG